MIKRYTLKKMGRTWTNWSKFRAWLDVELAVIEAKCRLGIYQPEISKQVKKSARFRVSNIIELDKIIEHDLQAFVEDVRHSLLPRLRKYLHEDMTSYDTEEPALALLIQRAGRIIVQDLKGLIIVLRRKASEHAWTYCMGNTHGQRAKPTTFGWRLCSYIELMERALKNFEIILSQTKEVKCSGAVGNYMTISPELEMATCQALGLKVRPVATQIVARDVIARFLNEIAVIGSCLDKMASDFRLQAMSGINEVEEPRKKKQKGSSAMPHKINTILLERICGMARVLRGNAQAGMEDINTWLERDISQSSVERIILPDSTILLDYMLHKMSYIVKGLVVNREQMARNIKSVYGCWASEEVKILLCNLGFDTEQVYTLVQTCAFKAFESRRSFKAVLLEAKFPRERKTIGELVPRQELNACFNFKRALKKHLPKAYERMGLNPELALPPNY